MPDVTGSAGDATERTAPDEPALDRLSSEALVARIAAGQRRAVEAVERAGPALARAVDAAAERLADPTGDPAAGRGRLAMLGAGASGRIAVQDGAELWPTFGWPAERLLLAIAGGRTALVDSVEGAEDDAGAGAAEAAAAGICSDDVVVAVAASGRSPWTVAWARAARERGALTVGLAGNAGTPLLEAVECPVLLDAGPEVLAGSTRLGAGTAQKAALNAFGTALMVRLNRTWGNLMVDMAARNAKLDARRVAMLRQVVPGLPEDRAAEALAAAGGSVKLAALVALGETPDGARARLARHAGSLRLALVSSTGEGAPGG